MALPAKEPRVGLKRLWSRFFDRTGCDRDQQPRNSFRNTYHCPYLSCLQWPRHSYSGDEPVSVLRATNHISNLKRRSEDLRRSDELEVVLSSSQRALQIGGMSYGTGFLIV